MHRAELRRAIRFLLVGVLNTGFGYAVFAFLVTIGVAPQPALALAFALGAIWNYVTHARLVFATRGFNRIGSYFIAYLMLYVVNAAALSALLRIGLPALIAQAVCLPFAAVLAYLTIGKVLTGRFPWNPPKPTVSSRLDQA